jgi:type II secretion system protein G
MNFKMKNQGFTLIEIIVVMLIIGLLAALGIGSFTSSQIKSRDARRKSDLRQIANALEIYYNDYGNYPLGTNGMIMGCGSGGVQQCNWGETFSATPVGGGAEVVYMVQMPEDTQSHAYYYVSDRSSYQLYARLENLLDRDIPKDNEEDPMVYQSTDCGIATCNFGVPSSNGSLAITIADN